ncbi:FAD-binding oxidoreductase [Brevundimonas sp. PAMC22021]|nr:FAD-binding oxidoreductase [Brevundimonas sp. PAMC22021]
MVIGAGVLGLCAALELQRRGRSVVVIDPGGDNASSVAAGMIAPAMEAAIEDVDAGHAALLRRARDLWPDFADAFGITLLARGAEWRGVGIHDLERRMRALGFDVRRDRDVLTATQELQVDPVQAMQAMRHRARTIAGQVSAMRREEGRWIVTHQGEETTAKVVVLATGAAPSPAGLPAVTARLFDAIQPIRGQIGRLDTPLVDHAVRGQGVYVAPGTTGAVVGATMDVGRRDLEPDPVLGERLMTAASGLLTRDLSNHPVEWKVGVRGASPDGLPIVGRAPGADDLWLSLAPRRNGWLLGPLAGQIIAQGVTGKPAGANARRLEPGRFRLRSV